MESTTASHFPSARSRRSVPNLEKLNIAPLSSNYPLEPADFSPVDPGTTTPHASYIQSKSTPATPGILSLSRSSSRTRQRRHRSQHSFVHDGYFPSSTTTPASPTEDQGFAAVIPKAKSASALISPILPSRRRTRQINGSRHAPGHPNKHTHKGKKILISAEWLHRAGLAIASETRDQKGQAWLASRASSTSLVPVSPENYTSPVDPSHKIHPFPFFASDNQDPSITVPRWPPPSNSRLASRAASARTSRRGSKIDHTPMAGSITPTSNSSLPGPDFLDIDDSDFSGADDGSDSDADDLEVARLAHTQSLGLGSWVDRLVGWTLFRVTEDGEEDDGESETEGEQGAARQEVDAAEAARRKKELEALRRRQLELINAASAKVASEQRDIGAESGTGGEAARLPHPPPAAEEGEGQGGWQDAAWLLSVASKVLL